MPRLPEQLVAAARRARVRVDGMGTLDAGGQALVTGRLSASDPWGAARLLVVLAQQDVSDPRVKDVARGFRARCHTDLATARALHAFVRDTVQFVPEPIETFQGADYTLFVARAGDCDDSARALYALACAAGFKARLRFLVQRGCPAHVYCEIWHDGRWWSAETTVQAFYGEDPADAARRLGITMRLDLGGKPVAANAIELQGLAGGGGGDAAKEGFSMFPSVRAYLDDFFVAKEGRTRHAYIDVLGYVTTGVGYLIESIAAMHALTWYRPDGSIATPQEVADAWTAVDGARTRPKGEKQVGSVAMLGGNSARMQALTTIRLSAADVERLFLERMLSFEQTIKRYFPTYDGLPADGQLLLLSIAWAMGPAFAQGYPRFRAAVNAAPPDFVTAGVEGVWRNENADRKAANALLAANAAASVRLGLDPSRLWYPSAIGGGAGIGGAVLAGVAGAIGLGYTLWRAFKGG